MLMPQFPPYPNALLQQESMTLIFVSLGIGIIGMAFGRTRDRESLKMHRWIMTGAVTLNLVAILAVMLPSAFNYYTDPSVDISAPFSILQIIHGVAGFPAIVGAMIFASNDLPRRTSRWMRFVAVLWVASVALGAIVYFTMPS